MSSKLCRILKMLSAIWLMIMWTSVRAGDVPAVVYPQLIQRASGPDGFVPPGWKIELLLKGDLSGAKHEDLVMVLRQNDPRNIVTHDGMCENPFDTNPRILAVAFSQPDGSYALTLENYTLIPRRDSPCIDDVLAEGNVAIDRRSLSLTLHRFASAGTWEMGNTTYKFRWQNRRFELIGYDDISVMRNSGEVSEVSVNFMTRKAKLSSGTVYEDNPSKVRWVKLELPHRWTPDEVGNDLDFIEWLSVIWRDKR
ncbi:hypothetical protein [Burkholderia cenocepacia]|uniref:hypothetical protein n=1 Tax=Burkholderia cenocepacia TaxID=95486 RepID=UPI00196A5E00|nr:hypothetical protein [Burkholderia cenocepacia]MBN3565458.1 hypothetical protein [Burkholderia cenocepacia]MBR8110991.1 hypothetical protein [Burkholderia cenocepacia]